MKREHEVTSSPAAAWPDEADDALLYALMQPWVRRTDDLDCLELDDMLLIACIRLVSRRWQTLVDDRLLPRAESVSRPVAARLNDWAAGKMCNLLRLDLRGDHESNSRTGPNTRLRRQGLLQFTRLRELRLGGTTLSTRRHCSI